MDAIIRNQRWLRRDRSRKPDLGQRKSVTVCIAALCAWNYAKQGDPEDWGLVAITASDRMITFGDVQYEPVQLKLAQMTKQTILLIAGDYSLHSEAIKSAIRELESRPNATPHQVALIYGRAMQAIKRRHAEDIYLAPLGLNTDLLIAQQKEMSESMSDRLITEMQRYEGEDVEALIVGIEQGRVKGEQRASIYHVDTHGSVTCADDVGFAAIGSGAWHARSQLMQAGYTKLVPYFRALATVFAAKKAADVSPGVGANFTDIHVVFRNGPERLVEEQREKLEELYADFVAKRAQLANDAITALTNFVIERSNAKQNEQAERQPGTDAQTNERTNSPAAEAPRSDETPRPEENPEGINPKATF
jgi:20S proteasome alpha/beta subunit